MKKHTQFEIYDIIKEAMADNAEIVEFCETKQAQLVKKSANSSKTQKANEPIKDAILKALADIARPVTISELQAENAEMAKYSNQKLSALLKQLVDNDKLVVKTSEKKKSFFSIV